MTKHAVAAAPSSAASRRAARAKAKKKVRLSPWAKFAEDGAKRARAAEKITHEDLAKRINTRD